MMSDLQSVISRVRALEEGLLRVQDRLNRMDQKEQDKRQGIMDSLAPETPAREKVWVIYDEYTGYLCTSWRGVWTTKCKENTEIRKIKDFNVARELARLLGHGDPRLVYRDTMEEVPGLESKGIKDSRVGNSGLEFQA